MNNNTPKKVTLEQLVKLDNWKMEVTPELNAKVQQAVFDAGYYFFFDQVKKTKYRKCNYLFFDDGSLSCSNSISDEGFNNNENQLVEIIEEQNQEIPEGLGPFYYEKVISNGYEVYTREGQKVEHLCIINEAARKPIVGYISNLDGVSGWYKDGLFLEDKEHENDLFLKKVKKVGWINVFLNNNCDFVSGDVFDAEQGAIDERNHDTSCHKQVTVKIEY